VTLTPLWALDHPSSSVRAKAWARGVTDERGMFAIDVDEEAFFGDSLFVHLSRSRQTLCESVMACSDSMLIRVKSFEHPDRVISGSFRFSRSVRGEVTMHLLYAAAPDVWYPAAMQSVDPNDEVLQLSAFVQPVRDIVGPVVLLLYRNDVPLARSRFQSIGHFAEAFRSGLSIMLGEYSLVVPNMPNRAETPAALRLSFADPLYSLSPDPPTIQLGEDQTITTQDKMGRVVVHGVDGSGSLSAVGTLVDGVVSWERSLPGPIVRSIEVLFGDGGPVGRAHLDFREVSEGNLSDHQFVVLDDTGAGTVALQDAAYLVRASPAPGREPRSFSPVEMRIGSDHRGPIRIVVESDPIELWFGFRLPIGASSESRFRAWITNVDTASTDRFDMGFPESPYRVLLGPGLYRVVVKGVDTYGEETILISPDKGRSQRIVMPMDLLRKVRCVIVTSEPGHLDIVWGRAHGPDERYMTYQTASVPDDGVVDLMLPPAVRDLRVIRDGRVVGAHMLGGGHHETIRLDD
jgi:hypothetical protein